MRGIIQRIESVPTKSGKLYHAITINNIKYSCWQTEECESLGAGDTIDFNAVQKDKYWNMYDPKLVATAETDSAGVKLTPLYVEPYVQANYKTVVPFVQTLIHVWTPYFEESEGKPDILKIADTIAFFYSHGKKLMEGKDE